MSLWKTSLEKLSFALVISVIGTVLLFIFRYFLIGLFGIATTVVLILLWQRSLFEELVVSFLKENNGYGRYDKLSKAYSKNAIARLKRKAVIRVQEDVVQLVDQNCVCAFDKFKNR